MATDDLIESELPNNIGGSHSAVADLFFGALQCKAQARKFLMAEIYEMLRVSANRLSKLKLASSKVFTPMKYRSIL